jgi:hypothetical protein
MLALQRSAGNRAVARWLQRSVKDTNPAPGLCGGPRTCAPGSACTTPDRTAAATGTPRLVVALDIEAPTAAEVSSEANVGHAYVEFQGGDGSVFTYGFYPDPTRPPNIFRTSTFGCMVHPDTIHERCVDYRETFTLTDAEYRAALDIAQAMCRTPPNYDLSSFNCTTFVARIATAAGKTLPGVRGRVGGGTIGLVADNPNTLYDALMDRDVPTRHLSGDSEMRTWITGHTPAQIAVLPVAEKKRLINRLLDGYVHDDDVAAIERICAAVTTAVEMENIDAGIRPRVSSLNARQGGRVGAALSRRP